MSMRIVRGLTARKVGAPSAKVLGAWPVFPGEELVSLQVQCQIFTTVSNDIDDLFEADIYALAVPYTTWQTYLDDNDDLDDLGNHPTSLAGFDNRFEQLMFDVDADDSQYYGGPDPDKTRSPAGGATPEDPIDPEAGDSFESQLMSSDDPIATARFRGPIGIIRLSSHEMLLSPWGADGVGVGRHWAKIGGQMLPHGIKGPMMVILGVRRNEVSGVATAASDYDAPNSVMDSTISGRISALQRLWGGDLHRNNLMLKRSNSDVARQMLGILYGSDQLATDAGVFGPVEAGNTSQTLGGIVNCGVKWAASYKTPYAMYDD